MIRILEPQLMEDQDQVLAYSNADFTSSNRIFIQYILENERREMNTVLDLGCGPADVDIDLANQLNDAHILAIDGSPQMISMAKHKIEANKLTTRVEAKVGKLPDLNIPTGKYDVIISKDLLHHLPDPKVLWNEARRLSNDNTVIYVMDLIRPDSKDEAKHIVERVAANEPEVLQIDFYNSLLAAFTIDEIHEQLKRSDLKYRIETLGDRHFVARCEIFRPARSCNPAF